MTHWGLIHTKQRKAGQSLFAGVTIVLRNQTVRSVFGDERMSPTTTEFATIRL